MSVWTEQQDDQAAFEEAMDVADVSLRRLTSQVLKLRMKVERLYTAEGKSRESVYGACLAMLDGLNATLEAPPISRWRQDHSEGRGKRHAQQHILEVKLAFARELLNAHGVDFDAELATRRLGS